MREPGGILGAIVARKRAEVAARLGGVAIADLRARVAPSRAEPARGAGRARARASSWR